MLDGPSDVYCGMNYTGSSCVDIFNNNLEVRDISGYYRINGNQWTYCNMTAIANGDNINISAGLGEWRKATQSGVSFCRVAISDSFSCSSANFSTNGISYQRVCGRARGYQKGDTSGFYGSDPFYNNRTIDEDYMFLDYQSRTVVIHVNTFGLLPVVVVNYLTTCITVHAVPHRLLCITLLYL